MPPINNIYQISGDVNFITPTSPTLPPINHFLQKVSTTAIPNLLYVSSNPSSLSNYPSSTSNLSNCTPLVYASPANIQQTQVRKRNYSDAFAIVSNASIEKEAPSNLTSNNEKEEVADTLLTISNAVRGNELPDSLDEELKTRINKLQKRINGKHIHHFKPKECDAFMSQELWNLTQQEVANILGLKSSVAVCRIWNDHVPFHWIKQMKRNKQKEGKNPSIHEYTVWKKIGCTDRKGYQQWLNNETAQIVRPFFENCPKCNRKESL